MLTGTAFTPRSLAGIAATSLVLAAPGAFAGENRRDEGFFLNGNLTAGYISESGGDTRYILGSADLGFRPAGGEGVGGALGIDSYFYNIDGTGENRLNGAYPVLTYDNFIGTFSIGNPRSVTDRGYGGDFSFAYSSVFDNAIALSFGSLAQQATLKGGESYGLRYDGGIGSALVGVSLHRANRSGADVTTYAIALSLPVTGESVEEGLSFYGGAEGYSGNGRKRIGYTIGAMLHNTKLSGEIRYRKTLLAPDTHIYEGRMEYRISDSLMLGLGLGHQSRQGDSSDFFGVGAQYSIFENGYLRGSLLKDADTSDPSLDFSVGFRF